jgi:hypothetical protein
LDQRGQLFVILALRHSSARGQIERSGPEPTLNRWSGLLKAVIHRNGPPRESGRSVFGGAVLA